MANLIQTITFLTNNNPSYVSGDIVQTYYDTGVIKVYKNNVLVTSGSSLTTGKVTIMAPPNPPVTEYTVVATGFQFCTGNDLNVYGLISTFPYVQHYVNANSPSCQVYVCDIAFSGVPVLTNPSNDTSADGQISVTATSSSGPIRYALQDIDYAVMTNSTGVFTGLMAGNYTVYAKDPHSCLATKAILLKAVFDYGVLYRMEYKNIAGVQSRIDILKKGWSGSVTTINTADETPIRLYMRGENSDKFNAIFPTEAEINLISTNDFDYQGLFSEYEHQYIAIWYKDLGSGLTELWRGANMPGLYTEPFTVKPYPATLQFTDQLALLSSYLFQDDSFNNYEGSQKVIQTIALVLQKTGLSLPIRCGVNVFDTGMTTTASSDPLDQAYIDLECFYNEDGTNPKDCKFVLQELLKPFGARIVQYYGYWWILENDSLTASFNYRQFDVNGVYVSNGTFSEIVNSGKATDANRLVWQDQGQSLEVIRSFGRLTIQQQTDPKESVIYNYGFEKPPLDDGSIQDWSFYLNGVTSESVYIYNRNDQQDQQITVNINPLLSATTLNSLTAKIASSRAVIVTPTDPKISWPTPNSSYENGFFISRSLPLVTIDPKDDIQFSIDYYVDFRNFGGIGPAYLGFRFMLQLGNWYLLERTYDTADANLGIITQKSDLTSSVATVSLGGGVITTFIDTGGHANTYQLFAGTDPVNDPLVLHPYDYNAVTNAKVWKLVQFDNWANANVVSSGWNEVWVKDPHKGWNTKKIDSSMPPVAGTGNLTVYIMPMWYSPIVSNTSILQAIPTTDKNPGFVFVGNYDSGNLIAGTGHDLHRWDDQYYQLVIPVPNQDVAAGYNLAISGTINGAVKPTDWDFNTNNQVWRFLENIPTKYKSSTDTVNNKTVFYGAGSISAFDNVIVKFKPQAQDPFNTPHIGNFTTDAPKSQNFILTTSSSIKNNIDYNVFLGDASLLVNNARFIYRNFFKLANGTPTSSWTRTGVSENSTLIAILCLRFLQQYANPTWKLSGTFATRYFSSGWKEQQVSPISTIVQNSRNLLPYYMEIDDKYCQVKVELQEVIAKTSIATHPFSAAFNVQQFGNSFDI